jgi:hypothetical protein
VQTARTAQTVGLVSALSDALGPWRRPTALHDPGKVQPDLAVSLAVGGECLADVAQLRGAPEVFGLVASDPTVTRLIDALAADVPAALAADLVAWMQTLALTGTAARRWEPKRLRLRLLSIPARHPAPAGAGCCTWPPPHHSPHSFCRSWPPSTDWPSGQRHQHRADRPDLAPTTGRPTGPRNRRPPEQPRVNRHTRMPVSRPRRTRTPTTDEMIMPVKDPGYLWGAVLRH